jgi:uncharacterized Zn-binding protein involved in type VI secretion
MTSRQRRRAILAPAAVLVLAAAPAIAAPAVRAGDRTTHGGTITGPVSPSVFIGGRPVARINDVVACPVFTGGIPHVGGPIVSGSATVLINGRPAARVGDRVTESGATSVIVGGAETVNIGP